MQCIVRICASRAVLLPFAEVVHVATAADERADLGAVRQHRSLREPRLHIASVFGPGRLKTFLEE